MKQGCGYYFTKLLKTVKVETLELLQQSKSIELFSVYIKIDQVKVQQE